MTLERMDPIDVLKDTTARKAFRIVLEGKSVPFQAIMRGLRLRLDSKTDRDAVKEAVEHLVETKLVAASVAPIEDFTSYYVTAQGLDMERYLRQPSAVKRFFP